MNEKEVAIVELLRKNPFLTQQDMASQLNISRPALANFISGLTKRGIITGRAYVLSDTNEVVCIGGANVDRKFHTKGRAQLGTSNPSFMSVSVGGVARNIGENLGRLGSGIRLLTVASNDADWQLIEQESASFMDVSAVRLLPDKSTGSYSAVIDPDGELIIAMANMDVYDLLTPDYIESNYRFLVNAKLVVLDLNCPKETIEFVKNRTYLNKTDLAIIPVSSPKMSRMPKDLKGVTWFICNQDEAETYTGLSINTKADWHNAVKILIEKGAENVVITAGSKGVMAGGIGQEILKISAIQGISIADVTGAGDAFVSGVLHGYLSGKGFVESIRNGIVNAAKTLESTCTVRPELTKKHLEFEMEEYK